jgi:hypothetical protein
MPFHATVVDREQHHHRHMSTIADDRERTLAIASIPDHGDVCKVT